MILSVNLVQAEEKELQVLIFTIVTLTKNLGCDPNCDESSKTGQHCYAEDKYRKSGLYMNIFADLKTWRFWKSFLTNAFACGGFVSAIFQFVMIVFPSQATSLQGLCVITGTVVVSIIFGIIVSWPRPIEMVYSAPKTTIKIISRP